MRTIDKVGRVCIPKELRNIYNLTEDSDIQLIDNGNGILVIPTDKPYTINEDRMTDLRKLYIMLNEKNLLDEEYKIKLAEITKETSIKCPNCKTNMFLTNKNTYKCYKCE